MVAFMSDYTAICGATMQEMWPQLKEETIMRLREGIRTDGNIIGNYKSGWYAWAKRYKEGWNEYDVESRGYMNVNLGLTGAFYNSIILIIDNSSAAIDAEDEKWDELREWYGDVLALPDETVDAVVIPGIREALLTELRAAFN